MYLQPYLIERSADKIETERPNFIPVYPKPSQRLQDLSTSKKKAQLTQEKGIKFTKGFFLMAIMVGTIYQLTTVVMFYFEFNITTDVVVDFPVEFQIPSFLICFRWNQVVIWDKMKVLKPHLMKRWHMNDKTDKQIAKMIIDLPFPKEQSLIYEFQMKLTVGQAIDYTESVEAVFDFCERIDANLRSFNKSCSEAFETTEFITPGDKCYLMEPRYFPGIFPINGSLSDFYNNPLRPGSIYLITTNSSREYSLKNIFFAFLPRGVRPTRGSLRFLDMTAFHPAEKLSHKIAYRSFEHVYLPAPYPTKCRDYKGDGDESVGTKGECFETCVQQKTEKGMWVIPGRLTKEEVGNKLFYPINAFVQPENKGIVAKIRKIEIDCALNCKSDPCVDTLLYPSLLSSSASSYNVLIAYAHHEPKIVTKSSPKYSLLNCFAEVSSVLGFNLGISLIGIINDVFDFFTDVQTVRGKKASLSNRRRSAIDLVFKDGKFAHLNNLY